MFMNLVETTSVSVERVNRPRFPYRHRRSAAGIEGICFDGNQSGGEQVRGQTSLVGGAVLSGKGWFEVLGKDFVTKPPFQKLMPNRTQAFSPFVFLSSFRGGSRLRITSSAICAITFATELRSHCRDGERSLTVR